MADFRPLDDHPIPVLYFDASVSATTLYEAFDYRLDVAFHLLNELSGAKVYAGDGLAPALASAAAMLMSDARRMSSALYGKLLDKERDDARQAAAELEKATAESVCRDILAGAERIPKAHGGRRKRARAAA